jgi:flagellar secretion chaperone FliS
MGMSQEVTMYRELAVQTASPLEVVVMLYDRLIRDLRQAADAIRIHDIEERVKQSNHALLILQELELMLNFEQGGETAKQLARVYSHVRAKIIESQIKLDPAILVRQAEFMLQLSQAWQRALATLPASVPLEKDPSSLEIAPYSAIRLEEEMPSCSWSA